jgi:hypothetical protein
MLKNEGGVGGDDAPSIKRRDCNVPPFKASSPTNQPTICAEIVGSDSCSALGIEARASAPVLALCRNLLAAGLDPDAAVEAYRAGTLVLRVRSIGEGALLTVEDNRFGTPVLRPWRDRDAGVGAAPPIRQNGAAGTGYPADVPLLLAGGVGK